MSEPGRPAVETDLDMSGRQDRAAATSRSETHAAAASSGRSGCRSSRAGRARRRTFDVMLDGADTAIRTRRGLPRRRGCCRSAAAWATACSCSTQPRSIDLVGAPARIADPLTRGAALVALWESMLEGRVAARRACCETLLTALPRETTSSIFSRCSTTRDRCSGGSPAADDRARGRADARDRAARRARRGHVHSREGRLVRHAIRSVGHDAGDARVARTASGGADVTSARTAARRSRRGGSRARPGRARRRRRPKRS